MNNIYNSVGPHSKIAASRWPNIDTITVGVIVQTRDLIYPGIKVVKNSRNFSTRVQYIVMIVRSRTSHSVRNSRGCCSRGTLYNIVYI